MFSLLCRESFLRGKFWKIRRQISFLHCLRMNRKLSNRFFMFRPQGENSMEKFNFTNDIGKVLMISKAEHLVS